MSLAFEYWTDPLCIWAYVGEAKLQHVLRNWGDRLEVRYRMIPIFGSLPRRFSTGVWSGTGREGRAEATRRIAREQSGVDLSGAIWLDPELSSSWPACEAIKAVTLLEDAGEAGPGSVARYQDRLRRARTARP